jgi:hypothetical protein
MSFTIDNNHYHLMFVFYVFTNGGLVACSYEFNSKKIKKNKKNTIPSD